MPFVKRHRDYYKYGTEPNASIVGSPTIVDGVASGFDASNYLTLPEVFNPKSNPWEFVVKIKTPTALSTYNCVWGTIGTYKDGLQFVGNKIYLYLSSNGSSWDITGTSLASTVTFNTDTTYYFKTYFTGTEYSVDYKTENGEYINCIKLSSSTPIFSTTSHYMGLGTNRGNTSWLGDGSIDLTQSYIKINGKDWWRGTKIVESTEADAEWYVDNNKLYNLATKKRTYYKYEYQDWTQPVLSANGTVGGDSFAVEATTSSSSYPAYKAFDNTNGYWIASTVSAYTTFYNPKPLKVTNLHVKNPNYSDHNYASLAGVIYGSDDNSSWVEIAQYTNSVLGNLAEWDIDLSTNTKFYKYHKIQNTKSNKDWVGFSEIKITAQEQLPAVETTKEEADYYIDKLTAYNPAVNGFLTYRIYEKQRDTGTYTFTLYEDYEGKLLFVGNGGPGNSSQADSQWHYSGGGSGACFEGIVRLPADTYTLTIGTLGYGTNRDNTHYNSGGVASTDSYLTNSAGQELIRVGAGGKGNTSVGGVSGAAGVLKLGTLDVVETIKAVNGNTSGKTAATNFAVSAYDGTATGYGAGTGAERYQGNVYGIAGIFKLEIEYQAEGIRSY